MSRRWIASTFLIVTLFGCTPGTTPATDAGKSADLLRFSTYGNIVTLDPALARDPQEIDIIANLYDRLLAYDQHGLDQPLPQAASAYQMENDGLSYLLHLHPNRYFAEPVSRPLNAFDVKASIERAISPAISRLNGQLAAQLIDMLVGAKSYVSGASDHVDGIEVVDVKTIRFRLIRPTPYFLPLLASPSTSIMPRELAERSPDAVGKNPVGSGPFVLQERRGATVVLTRSPRWDNTGPIRRIEYVHAASYEEAIRHLGRGEVDLVFGRGFDYTTNVNSHFYLASEWLAINIAAPPLDRVDLRRALLWAADNRGFSYGGPGRRDLLVTAILPRNMLGFNSSMFGTLRSPEKSQRYMAQSGILPARPLTLSYVEQVGSTDRLDKLVASLSETGIEIILRPYPMASRDQFYSDLQAGKGDLYWVSWVASAHHPYYLLKNFSSSALGLTNYQNWSSPAFDQLLDRLSREPRPDIQENLVRELHGKLIDEAVVIPLYTNRTHIAFRRPLANFKPGSLPGARYDNVRFRTDDAEPGA